MTRIITVPALGLAALLLVPALAAAQTPARAFVGTAVGGAALAAGASGADEMSRAQLLARAGQYRKAARVYHAAAEAQLRDGKLPETALWQEASMYFAVDETARAAAALDRLGQFASAHGNPVVEVKAKLNAAVLYAKTGDAERAMALAASLRTLRNSPFIGDDLRAELDMKIGHK